MSGIGRRLATLAKELFDVRLGDRDVEMLERFVELLERWAAKTNLISAASRQEIVDRHLLDSVAVLPLLSGVRSLADFGSGAGFPGLPLAVVKPDTNVHLIESRRRRANFLRHTVRTLELRNALVHETRAEKWRPEVSIEAALGRGIRVEELANLARAVLGPNGALLVMSKLGQHGDIPGFVRDGRLSYTLPGGERHEVSRYQIDR